MKRDDDLIRQIMLDMVDSLDPSAEEFSYFSATEAEKRRSYHINLLVDADYLAVQDERLYCMSQQIPTNGGRPYSRSRISRVTNLGQDFVATVQDDTIWAKTKEGAATVGGGSLVILKDIAVAYVKQAAADKLGIKL